MQQPARQAQLTDQLGALTQVAVNALGAGDVVGVLNGVQAVHRRRGVHPGQVLGRVPDMRLGPAPHGHHRATGHQDVLLGEVPVDHGGAEAPQGGVLQGLLPAPQQRRWGPARRGGVVQQAQPAPTHLLGVVDRHTGLGDHRHGQLVDLTERLAQARRHPRPWPERLHRDRLALHMGADLNVRVLLTQRPGDARNIEGEPSVVDDPSDAAQHLGLGLQGGAHGIGAGLMDLPVAALGVDDADDVPLRGLGLRQRQPSRVEAGDGDARHRRQGERGVVRARSLGGLGLWGRRAAAGRLGRGTRQRGHDHGRTIVLVVLVRSLVGGLSLSLVVVLIAGLSLSALDVGGHLIGEAVDTAVDISGAGGVRGLRRL